MKHKSITLVTFLFVKIRENSAYTTNFCYSSANKVLAFSLNVNLNPICIMGIYFHGVKKTNE